MITIASIVEGKGEVTAVPILLHRIAREVSPNSPNVLVTPPPHRVQRNQIAKEGEVEKAVDLVARRRGRGRGGILILLDADDDCPMELAAELLGRACAAREDQHIRVVLAKREYEAWFLAAARSLADWARHLRVDHAASTARVEKGCERMAQQTHAHGQFLQSCARPA